MGVEVSGQSAQVTNTKPGMEPQFTSKDGVKFERERGAVIAAEIDGGKGEFSTGRTTDFTLGDKSCRMEDKVERQVQNALKALDPDVLKSIAASIKPESLSSEKVAYCTYSNAPTQSQGKGI